MKLIPLFKEGGFSFVTQISEQLQFEVFQKGDVILGGRNWTNRVYFIKQGVVTIRSSGGNFITHLSDGAYFGG